MSTVERNLTDRHELLFAVFSPPENLAVAHESPIFNSCLRFAAEPNCLGFGFCSERAADSVIGIEHSKIFFRLVLEYRALAARVAFQGPVTIHMIAFHVEDTFHT